MPLTDAEIDKIATAVWKKAIASMWDGTNKPASVMLAQTNFYAIQGGILGTTPATATSNAGKRTALGQVYDESVIDGAGGTGATPDQIADELAQRLEE